MEDEAGFMTWSPPARKQFSAFVSAQMAAHKDFPLSELNQKVVRHSQLVGMHESPAVVTTEGGLNLSAKLVGTLVALLRCEAGAASRALESAAKSKAWFEVRVFAACALRGAL